MIEPIFFFFYVLKTVLKFRFDIYRNRILVSLYSPFSLEMLALAVIPIVDIRASQRRHRRSLFDQYQSRSSIIFWHSLVHSNLAIIFMPNFPALSLCMPTLKILMPRFAGYKARPKLIYTVHHVIKGEAFWPRRSGRMILQKKISAAASDRPR